MSHDMKPLSKRADEALQILTECGDVDGDHHKTWVIDQAIRSLMGPVQYANWRQEFEDEQGYSWDEGIAP